MKVKKATPGSPHNRLARAATSPKNHPKGKPPEAKETSAGPAVLPRDAKRLLATLCLAIGLATLAVYAQTAGYGFVDIDDPTYVYDNPMLKAGLTAAGFSRAFTSFYFANWHPLTLLSYKLDYEIFGLNAGAQHLENAALHLASALLLFLALVRMTRQPWRSALVAGVFALHPLHVESVAWISERKDVLSALFAMFTLLLYVRYTEAPTARRYISMAAAFALGLMAKPMLVTFPFVLLLLDFWPLRRLAWPPAWPAFRHLVWEKGPLFAMAAASSILTSVAQRSAGAMVSFGLRPYPARFANAAVSYIAYIGKALWPANLAVLYPYHPSPTGYVLGALLILVAMTVACVHSAKRRPFLLVGWLWYAGMLVPVIGIVQVGEQAMADRYMYLPLVGLSLAAVWGSADFVQSSRLPRKWAGMSAVVALLVLGLISYRQTAYWKNSHTLFEHTLAITQGNRIILCAMGWVLANEGNSSQAIAHFQEAIAFGPEYAEAYENLGVVLGRLGRLDEALTQSAKAVRLKPDYPDGQINLCALLVQLGRFAEALPHCAAAVQLKPESPEGHCNLCADLSQLGRPGEAIAQCTEAVRLKPDYADARNNLCLLLGQAERFAEAVPQCAEAVRLKPDNLEARYNLGNALAAQGEKAEALRQFFSLLAADPGHSGARAALQRLQENTGR